MKPYAIVMVAALLAAGACAPAQTPPPERQLDIVEILGGGDEAGFERAMSPRDFVFPDDHGPHPTFAAEWWYFTGNVESDEGRRFGYQLTFFRTSLLPATMSASRNSAWASNQVWMAHFAVTDVEPDRFFAFDRFQRGALGLAGAQSEPWRVWLDDWSLEQVGEAPFPLRLRAHQGTTDDGDGEPVVAIDLIVDAAKPIVLQGERGLSRKGPTPGNASFYYSFTRLKTDGNIRTEGRNHVVSGSSWLDREWSTSALESGQVGWDWFALQLDDRSEVMFYQLRDAAGRATPQSAGMLVLGDGTSTPLAGHEVSLQVERSWNSPRDATTYPAEWTLAIPGRGVRLRIVPVVADQELDVAFRYWEGAVDVSGIGLAGTEVGGRGYVELTGYAGGGPSP